MTTQRISPAANALGGDQAGHGFDGRSRKTWGSQTLRRCSKRAAGRYFSGQANRQARQYQSGFSLVEVSIVTALMVILAIIGIPALQDYVIENKVPKVASDLQRFVARMKVTALGGGETPYESVDQRVLINGLRGGSAITVRGESPNGVVVHGLGGRGSKGNGEISLSPDAGPDMPTGSAFSLTLDHVNHAACPMLVSTLQRMAVLVKVAGKGGEVEVKNGFSSPVIPYQPVLADAQCQRGDSNRFVFVFQ